MKEDKQNKWLFLAIKLAILAVLVWSVHKSLEETFESLRKHESWHVDPAWLVLSGILYLIGMMPPAIFGQQLLVGAGRPVPLLDAVRAFFLSQPGKYVPGKAMVLVLRAALLRRAGVPATLVTAVVFMETLTAMASGSLVAILCLTIWYPDRKMPILAAALMLAATALPILPPVFKLVVRVLHITRLNLETVHKLAHVGRGVIVSGWVSIGLSWIPQGLGLWAALVALGAADTNPLVHLPLHTAAWAMAVVAGFLALIPGGLGVREWVLIQLLGPVYGNEIAVVSAIILRLVSLAAEVVAAGIVYPMRANSVAAAASAADLD